MMHWLASGRTKTCLLGRGAMQQYITSCCIVSRRSVRLGAARWRTWCMQPGRWVDYQGKTTKWEDHVDRAPILSVCGIQVVKKCWRGPEGGGRGDWGLPSIEVGECRGSRRFTIRIGVLSSWAEDGDLYYTCETQPQQSLPV